MKKQTFPVRQNSETGIKRDNPNPSSPRDANSLARLSADNLARLAQNKTSRSTDHKVQDWFVKDKQNKNQKGNDPQTTVNCLAPPQSLSISPRSTSLDTTSAESSLSQLSHALLRDYHNHLLGVLPAEQFLSSYFPPFSSEGELPAHDDLVSSLLHLVKAQILPAPEAEAEKAESLESSQVSGKSQSGGSSSSDHA